MHQHRLFSLIIAFVLVISSIIVEGHNWQAQASTFLDVTPTNPAYAPISQLVAAGVLTTNPYFFPNRPLTRAELSKMLIGAGKYQSVFSTLTAPNATYCDVPVYHWAASYIATLTTYQIVTGSLSYQCNLSRNFYPDLPITKADASKMVLKLYSLSPSDDSFSNFVLANQLGLISSTNPYQWLTRAEASQMLIKAMTYYSDHYTEIMAVKRVLNSSTPSYSRRSRSNRSGNDFVPPSNSSTQVVINNTAAPSSTITPSATPSPTPSITPTPSATPTPTGSPSSTPTVSPTPTSIPSPPPSPTASATPSASPSSSPSPSPSPSPTASASSSPSPSPSPSASPSAGSLTYDIGSPTVQEYWLSTAGSDSNPGTQSQPFRTFTHAWSLVPQDTPLTTGFKFNVLSGTYSAPDLYIEDRLGTASAPVIFQGQGSVSINGNFNSRNLKYIYFINLSYTSPNDVMHFEASDHILLRNVTLHSPSHSAHETLKVNQTQYFYIEDSNISGSYENAIDFVAVQYGHIVRSRIHDADDWCIYTKGGSAHFRIENNEIYDCGTGGYTAGQGTGFEYMTTPWLHYEAYDIRFVNNIVHDTIGAGIGINGGYNILMAHNTMYRVGSNSHVIEVVFGSRSCDGELANCSSRRGLGGWGPITTSEEVFIGNKHVRILDNIVYNPSNPAGQIFAIYGPRATPSGSNAPNPAVTDSDLVIAGNIIWNGPSSTPLGIGGEQGCLDSNSTCNAAQLVANNAINTIQPNLNNPAIGNFQLMNRSSYASLAVPLPTFSWTDAPSPPAIPTSLTVSNLPYTHYRDGSAVSANYPGAY